MSAKEPRMHDPRGTGRTRATKTVSKQHAELPGTEPMGTTLEQLRALAEGRGTAPTRQHLHPDADLLRAADASIRPAHGELHHTGFAHPGCLVTRSSGSVPAIFTSGFISR